MNNNVICLFESMRAEPELYWVIFKMHQIRLQLWLFKENLHFAVSSTGENCKQ